MGLREYAVKMTKKRITVEVNESGDIILSEHSQPEPKSWEEIFSMLDAAGGAEDLLSDR